jgi:hypothetical protein
MAIGQLVDAVLAGDVVGHLLGPLPGVDEEPFGIPLDGHAGDG